MSLLQQQGQRSRGTHTVSSTFAAIKQCAEGLFKQKTRDLTKLQQLTLQQQELEGKHNDMQVVLLTLKQLRSRGDATLDAQQARVAEREALLKSGERQDADVHELLQSLLQCSKATQVCQDVLQKFLDGAQQEDVLASMSQAEVELGGRSALHCDLETAEYARRIRALRSAKEELDAESTSASSTLLSSLASWAEEWPACTVTTGLLKALEELEDPKDDAPLTATEDRERLATLAMEISQADEASRAANVACSSLNEWRVTADAQFGLATRLCDSQQQCRTLQDAVERLTKVVADLEADIEQLQTVERTAKEATAEARTALEACEVETATFESATALLEVTTQEQQALCNAAHSSLKDTVARLAALRSALEDANVDVMSSIMAEADDVRQRTVIIESRLAKQRDIVADVAVQEEQLQHLHHKMEEWEASVRCATMTVREALHGMDSPLSAHAHATLVEPPMPSGGEAFIADVEPVADVDAENTVQLHLSIANAHSRRQLEAIEKQISASVSRMQ